MNVVKYFWPCSNMQNYKVKYHFWPCSKIFDQVQKILNKVKKVWTRSKYFWTSRWNRHNFSATYPDSVRKKFCWVIFIENTYLSMGPRGRVTSMAHFFLIYSKRFDKSQLNFWLRACPFWRSRIIKTILKIFTPNSLQKVVVSWSFTLIRKVDSMLSMISIAEFAVMDARQSCFFFLDFPCFY